MAKMVLRHRFDVDVWVVERLKNIAAPGAWLLFLKHAAFAPCVHLQCVITRSANIRITIPARKLTILDSESKKIQPVDANQRIVIRGIQGQVVVLGIVLQPILPFQVTADSVRQGMRQLRQFSTCPHFSPGSREQAQDGARLSHQMGELVFVSAALERKA